MPVNKKPKTDWKTGDTCYYIGPFTDKVNKATITDVLETENKAIVLNDNSMKHYVTLTTLFKTKKEADAMLKDYLSAKKTADEKIVQKYCDQMHTVADLIRFGYENAIGRYMDERADPLTKRAFLIRAEELLGLRLDD